jgi:hypothetical protein
MHLEKRQVEGESVRISPLPELARLLAERGIAGN